MKRIIVLLTVCAIPFFLNAQVNNLQLPLSINTSGNDPDSSAILDVQSTDKGILVPRMTTTQRDSIANPATSLVIYNLDDSAFQSWNGITWTNISGPWEQSGDSIYYNTGNVGIGTDTPEAKLSLSGGNFLHSASDPVHAGSITDNGTTELDGPLSIYVSGKYAYVASYTDDGVEILDISDPANPTHVGAISDNATTALNGANSIYVSGKYAYVTAGIDNGVEILDISDPTNPMHVGAIKDNATTTLSGANGIYVSGKYAYVNSYDNEAVEILDISDPANPKHVGNIINNGATKLAGPLGIYVSGKYAYVACYDDYSIEILDISDPANPTHVGAITDNATTALAGANDIYVSGKYAYVSSSDESGVEILDISDPANPTHVGAIMDDETTALSGANSIYVSGKYAYVTSPIDHGVEVLDISDPANPTHVGVITDNASTTLSGANDIYVSGKYAYVTSVLDKGVEVLDISGMDAPSASIGNIATNTLDVSENVQVGNDLYVGNGLQAGHIYSQGEISVNGTVDATAFVGDGSGLTNLPTADNLGNHTATQNLILNGNYLSGDGDNEGIRIDNNGNVGIGTPTPSSPLHIEKTLDNGTLMTLTNNGTGNANILKVTSGSNGTTDIVDIQNGAFVVEGNGQVGIGTTTPAATLDIARSGDGANVLQLSTERAWAFQQEGTSNLSNLRLRNVDGLNKQFLIDTDGSTRFRSQDGSSTVMTIDQNNGRVGIGTTNPTQAKVVISGSVSNNLGSFGYLNASGNTGTSSGANPYSLYANERIAAGEFNAHSDIRIKNIRGTSNPNEDLATLMHIQVSDYTLRDTIAKGKTPQKKVIAQQVAKVYPQAVKSDLTEVVPDIYQKAEIENGWIMLPTDLQTGERVKIITENNAEVYEVDDVEDGRFLISQLKTLDPQPKTVFVYGREVNDFHTVDYEAISMLNVSATQEQQRIIDSQQHEIELLKAQLEALQSSFEERLTHMEALLQLRPERDSE